MTDYVIVGKIGSTYGVRGWLKILSYTEATTNILEYQPWYLEQGKDWKPVEITGSRAHGNSVIVKFPDIDNPEQARRLTGKKIAVMRSQLPTLKQDEFYWNDLKGLTVINQHGETLGKIIYLIAAGSNDVLVVKGDEEYAIPYLLKRTVISIDLNKKIMRVNWEKI